MIWATSTALRALETRLPSSSIRANRRARARDSLRSTARRSSATGGSPAVAVPGEPGTVVDGTPGGTPGGVVEYAAMAGSISKLRAGCLLYTSDAADER